YLDNPVELTQLLAANQISIEHRFFASSRPEPADWSKLTISQMADDEHAIIVAMRSIFPGKVLTTGGSKGGMTAVYHRRFYPDDVAGTVPYVAPISFGAPDTRYTPFLDTVGPPACRQAVRDVAVELLANRRAAMLARATMQATTSGSAFTRVPIGPAVEVSIASLEWGFWQYYGLGWCPAVPPVTADDDTLFGFLDMIVPIADSDDASSAQFEAYYHQAYAQLGYPAASVPYLEPYLMYTDADYLGSLPTTPPTYDDGAAMADIDGFVRQDSERMLFVYGQWDPWTGGAFELGAARDSLDLVQAEGTHGAHLTGLAPADRDAAFARLAAWTGVTPVIPPAGRMVAPRPAPILRVPPPRSRRLPVAAP
ncbi:MAG: S28 family serine protease, partial [Proteobacteria bacterium]|nr:S28 family serine protease [Pseudomonadota bacterium]